MMKNRLQNIFLSGAAVLAVVFAAGCGESKFKIEGEVKGGDGETLILEKPDATGRWIALDSTHLESDGKFKIEFMAPASPEIYRVSMNGNYVYLPVDSTETITLSTSSEAFGRDFTLTGSAQAEKMTEFEKSLMQLDADNAEALAKFKRDVFNNYLKDGRGSILSYYVLTKTIGNKPLYDPADKTDAKYFAAVATAFDQYKPEDPHTQMLKNVSIKALKETNKGKNITNVLEADEISMIDVALNDENGNKVKLSDVAGKGKPAVVVFALMNDADSPMFNRELHRIYDSRGGNIAIYHISYDSDVTQWREAARNLPWTTLYDPAGFNSTVLRDYYVTELPAFFIYDSKGELVDRADSFKSLESKMQNVK